MLSIIKWVAVVVTSIPAIGVEAQTAYRAAGEACGFRILASAERFRELAGEKNDAAASRLFLDSQSIGAARIVEKADIVSLADRSGGMACVRRENEPFCYWMSDEDFAALASHAEPKP